MTVRCFTMAEHAATIDGRLYLAAAGMTQVVFDTFPARLPSVGIGLDLTTRLHEESVLTLRLIAPDGSQLHTEAAGLHADEQVRSAPASLCVSWMLRELELPEPGDYLWLLDLDGVVVARLGFTAEYADEPRSVDEATTDAVRDLVSTG